MLRSALSNSSRVHVQHADGDDHRLVDRPSSPSSTEEVKSLRSACAFDRTYQGRAYPDSHSHGDHPILLGYEYFGLRAGL